MPAGSVLPKLEELKNLYEGNQEKQEEIQLYIDIIPSCMDKKHYGMIFSNLEALGKFLLAKANKKRVFSRNKKRQELLNYLITLLYYPTQPKFKNDSAVQFLKHDKYKEDDKIIGLIEKVDKRIKKYDKEKYSPDKFKRLENSHKKFCTYFIFE